MFSCCVDTVGLLVDRTRVVAGFNHGQARGRGGGGGGGGRNRLRYCQGLFTVYSSAWVTYTMLQGNQLSCVNF